MNPVGTSTLRSFAVLVLHFLELRIHYVVHTPDGIPEDYDVSEIEGRLVRAVRAWTDDLRVALTEELGAEKAQSVYRRYDIAFPPGYRDAHTAEDLTTLTAEDVRGAYADLVSLMSGCSVTPAQSIICSHLFV